MKNLILRAEKPEQYREMEELVRDAFWDKYSPGCVEHLLVHRFRSAPEAVPELCLAAEFEGKPVGGIWYAHAAIRHRDKPDTPVLTLGPAAVRPDLQGRGIGSEMIRNTLERAGKFGLAVVLYGNPEYYRRFGFRPGADFGITDAAGEKCPALQVCPLGKISPGAFDEGALYAIPPEEVRAFDRQFPHRQKHLKSGQLFFVPPSPPPDDPLLRRSWELRSRACRFLKNSGILEAWEKTGAKIRSVGSFRTGLMMKDRDIDLHIYTEALDKKQSLEAMEPLLASPRTVKLTYRNGADTDEHCLEWHLEMKDEDGSLWTVDLIQLAAGSRWDGHFEDTADAVERALTPEKTKCILALKAAEPEGSKICGIEFCKAVLSDGVTTWDEFLQWRKAVSGEELLNWRP